MVGMYAMAHVNTHSTAYPRNKRIARLRRCQVETHDVSDVTGKTLHHLTTLDVP